MKVGLSFSTDANHWQLTQTLNTSLAHSINKHTLTRHSPVVSAVQHGGHSVKHAWKVNNVSKQKWYILYARSPDVKREWLAAFERERMRVKEDQASGECVCDDGKGEVRYVEQSWLRVSRAQSCDLICRARTTSRRSSRTGSFMFQTPMTIMML